MHDALYRTLSKGIFDLTLILKKLKKNGSLIDENNCHQNHGVTYKMDQEKLVVGDL